eukprot:258937-Pyramimonas_sp.AAC.1
MVVLHRSIRSWPCPSNKLKRRPRFLLGRKFSRPMLAFGGPRRTSRSSSQSWPNGGSSLYFSGRRAMLSTQSSTGLTRSRS